MSCGFWILGYPTSGARYGPESSKYVVGALYRGKGFRARTRGSLRSIGISDPDLSAVEGQLGAKEVVYFFSRGDFCCLPYHITCCTIQLLTFGA